MIERGTRVDQLAREFEEAILSGRLAKGEPLPSDRRLAEAYRLSRVTIRAAVQRLIGKGLVLQASGLATVVTDLPWTFDRLVEQIRAQRGNPSGVSLFEDLLATRTLHVAEAARRACERGVAPGELRFLIGELRRQLERRGHPRLVNRLERSLFDALVGASGSVALGMLIASFDRVHDCFPELVEALPDGLSAPPAFWDELASRLELQAPGEVSAWVRSALARADQTTVVAFRQLASGRVREEAAR